MKSKNISPILVSLTVFSLVLAACGGSSDNSSSNNKKESKPLFSFPQIFKRTPHNPSPGFSGNGADDSSSNNFLSELPSYEGSQEEPAGELQQNDWTLPSSSGAPESTSPADAKQPSFLHPSPTSTPTDMFFDDYGVNPSIDTDDDHLSTFALDVDTGSFTLARNYLRDGNLPPQNAVRTEEFINYFSQGYPFPSERETFGIYIDGGPTPFTETDKYHMLRVGIQGYDVPRSERKDLSLTFVIDVSGSMAEGNRLELVKESLNMLVDQLHSDDEVSIVAYSSNAWTILKPTSGSRKDKILDAIFGLYPRETTNAEAGLKLGYKHASFMFRSNAVNRVILLSDGVANVGHTGPGSIWESISRYAKEDITLTTVGVGMGNYNDVLLEQLADNGQGHYTYIDTLEEAERLFVRDLVSTLQVIALDTKIQVDFNPDVVARYRLVGFENRDIADEDFLNDDIDAAEIGAGHSATALYEIKLHPRARGQIATVFLRWEDPDSGAIRETSEQFFTDELSRSFESTDKHFQMDVLIAEFAEILRESYWARESSFSDVLDYAEHTAKILEGREYMELLTMIEQAARLDRFH